MYRTGRRQGIVKPKLAEVPRTAVPVVAAAVPPPPPPPPPYIPPAPQPAPVPVANLCEGLDGVLDGVNFHTNSAELTASSIDVLEDIAYKLSTCDSLQIEIAAHTDSHGAEAYNQALSERRAQSVVDYFSASGLDRGRLTATAFGESDPIDSNASAEGRALNRRVELYAR